MRILFNDNVYGWIMTGLLGKDGKWFLGYSKAPDSVQSIEPKIVSNTMNSINPLIKGKILDRMSYNECGDSVIGVHFKGGEYLLLSTLGGVEVETISDNMQTNRPSMEV